SIRLPDAFLISCQVRENGSSSSSRYDKVREGREEGGRIVAVDDHRGKAGRARWEDIGGEGREKVKVQRGRKQPVRLRDILLSGAPTTIALLAFRICISRALEHPLILHRLEKPEIKKKNMRRYTYRGGLHPGALLLPTRVLGASTIRFALDEHARTNRRLFATSENTTTTITLRDNGPN
ncbi:hypothetical protein ALC60_10109, partial [Trachymyrmex zeteki]